MQWFCMVSIGTVSTCMSPNYQSQVSTLFCRALVARTWGLHYAKRRCSKNAFWEEPDYLADCTVRDAMVVPPCFRLFASAPPPDRKAAPMSRVPLGHDVCMHQGLRDRVAVPSAHGQGRRLHERTRLLCEGWPGLVGHMQGSPPTVRRIGGLFWWAPPLLMSLSCARGAGFLERPDGIAPMHVSPSTICSSYAPELRARLVCGAPLFASSWCLANAHGEEANTCIRMFKMQCGMYSHVRNAMWIVLAHSRSM